MFQVASITKSFKEKSVLKGVSFSIEEGDKIALLEIMEQEKVPCSTLSLGSSRPIWER